MATVELGDRIWFQVPTSQGTIDVALPGTLSPREADSAGGRIQAIIAAMFPWEPIAAQPVEPPTEEPCPLCGRLGPHACRWEDLGR